MGHDVMIVAAYRHRWVLAWRELIEREPGRSRRFEQVRVASMESFERGQRLDDVQIAARVEELTREPVWWEKRGESAQQPPALVLPPSNATVRRSVWSTVVAWCSSMWSGRRR